MENNNKLKKIDALTIDDNTSPLIKSIIALEKIKNSDNVISEKSKEFLKEIDAISKTVIENTVNSIMETIEHIENNKVDVSKVDDETLYEIIVSEIDTINMDLMETCIYNDMNGNGKYVKIVDYDLMDITPATSEYVHRFGIYKLFDLIDLILTNKTHVVYTEDNIFDYMYIQEVIPRDNNGNVLEYYYKVGDIEVRYHGITEKINEKVGDKNEK